MKRSFKETRNAAEENGARETADARELFDKYSGMSEAALMHELDALTQKQRSEGSFDRAAIEHGAQAILPMLNEEQRKKLKGILQRL